MELKTLNSGVKARQSWCFSISNLLPHKLTNFKVSQVSRKQPFYLQIGSLLTLNKHHGLELFLFIIYSENPKPEVISSIKPYQMVL